MYLKAKELLLECYKVMGLVSGTAVQTYTEPQVYAGIQMIFDLVYKKRMWDHLTDWHVITIDGVTGLSITDVDAFLTDHTDIARVCYADFSRNINRPVDIEHMQVNGASPMYWTPIRFDQDDQDTFIKKVIKFWPITSTASVAIRCRSKPRPFVPEDYVPFDSAVMANGAAWKALDADGINPTAASMAQQMFDLMYQDYVAADGETDIGYGGGRTNVPLTIRTI